MSEDTKTVTFTWDETFLTAVKEAAAQDGVPLHLYVKQAVVKQLLGQRMELLDGE